MRYTTYRYNSFTCQYERVKVNAGSVIWYSLGVVVVASCMLLGILLLHDLLINTPNETALREENNALRKHHTRLAAELNALQPVLTTLQNKDRVLHARFFGTPMLETGPERNDGTKEALLLADPATFRAHISSIRKTSAGLMRRSMATNRHYGSALALSEEALEQLNARPTLQPVMQWQSATLISGFGLRVNPFHKGLYDHPGIDIAMPRGTPVIATGPGVVRQLKKSDLQAGYGNYVEIDHGDGITTRYAHLEEIHVRFGADVKKGEVIGTVGSSGGSVAPHVHYEIIHHGKNVDPVAFMVEGLSSEEHDRLAQLSGRQNQSLD